MNYMIKKLTIKETKDKVVLQLGDISLTQQEANYWEGIYIKELFYQTVQSANRNYAYIDKEVVRQMLPEGWYIDFHTVNQIPFFSLRNYPNEYMYRWFGECITLRLLAGYPIEFTKMQFTESGELVL